VVRVKRAGAWRDAQACHSSIAPVLALPAVDPVSPPAASPALPSHVEALEASLAALELGERDAAAVGVARSLAAALDVAGDDRRLIASLAPKYLGALRALRLTPGAGYPVRVRGIVSIC